LSGARGGLAETATGGIGNNLAVVMPDKGPTGPSRRLLGCLMHSITQSGWHGDTLDAMAV